MGRTARAGRSGLAISLVNQYEVEWYLQIEKLIGRHICSLNWLRVNIDFKHQLCNYTVCINYYSAGKKLPEYPAEEVEVLVLLERVTDAKRISLMV